MFFIRTGAVAVCEPSSYREPILVYTPGTVFNLYQVLIEVPLEVSFMAVSSNSYKVSDDESTIYYDALSAEYFSDKTAKNKGRNS